MDKKEFVLTIAGNVIAAGACGLLTWLCVKDIIATVRAR